MRDPLEADKISGAEIESVTPILLLLVVAFAFFFLAKAPPTRRHGQQLKHKHRPPPLFPVSASGV